MSSPVSGWWSFERKTTRAASAGKGRRARAAMVNAPRPESRSNAMAERPGGVASATIGSDSTLPPFRLAAPLGLALPAQPLLRDAVLLRNTHQVLHEIIQVQPG